MMRARAQVALVALALALAGPASADTPQALESGPGAQAWKASMKAHTSQVIAAQGAHALATIQHGATAKIRQELAVRSVSTRGLMALAEAPARP